MLNSSLIQPAGTQPPVSQPMSIQNTMPARSGLPEVILANSTLLPLNLRAVDAIKNRDTGDSQTLRLLRATLLENTRSLAPLQQLDTNFIRLSAARTLIELANNPDFDSARQMLSEMGKIILARPFDDTSLKAELLYGLKNLGLDDNITVATEQGQEVAAKLQDRIELEQRLQKDTIPKVPHHTASSANFQVLA